MNAFDMIYTSLFGIIVAAFVVAALCLPRGSGATIYFAVARRVAGGVKNLRRRLSRKSEIDDVQNGGA